MRASIVVRLTAQDVLSRGRFWSNKVWQMRVTGQQHGAPEILDLHEILSVRKATIVIGQNRNRPFTPSDPLYIITSTKQNVLELILQCISVVVKHLPRVLLVGSSGDFDPTTLAFLRAVIFGMSDGNFGLVNGVGLVKCASAKTPSLISQLSDRSRRRHRPRRGSGGARHGRASRGEHGQAPARAGHPARAGRQPALGGVRGVRPSPQAH